MAKPKGLLVFRNWDEVNQALKEVGDIDRTVTRIEADMNRRINDIKAEAERDAADLLSRRKILETNIQEFTESYSDEFKVTKSKKFMYGSVGFRKVNSIAIRNIKAVIEALKQNKMTDCISISEKINKEELEKYDDVSLSKIGAKRKVEDKFFYELAEERIDA